MQQQDIQGIDIQQQCQAHNLVHWLAIGYQASLWLKCGSPVAASAFLETGIQRLVLHKDTMTKKNNDHDNGSLFVSHKNWLLQELDRKDHPNYGRWTALEPYFFAQPPVERRWNRSKGTKTEMYHNTYSRVVPILFLTPFFLLLILDLPR
jgi:hypothetical protein